MTLDQILPKTTLPITMPTPLVERMETFVEQSKRHHESCDECRHPQGPRTLSEMVVFMVEHALTCHRPGHEEAIETIRPEDSVRVVEAIEATSASYGVTSDAGRVVLGLTHGITLALYRPAIARAIIEGSEDFDEAQSILLADEMTSVILRDSAPRTLRDEMQQAVEVVHAEEAETL